jgi:hypothetical protein
MFSKEYMQHFCEVTKTATLIRGKETKNIEYSTSKQNSHLIYHNNNIMAHNEDDMTKFYLPTRLKFACNWQVTEKQVCSYNLI